jgi:hypothetical protein
MTLGSASPASMSRFIPNQLFLAGPAAIKSSMPQRPRSAGQQINRLLRILGKQTRIDPKKRRGGKDLRLC